MKIYRNYKLKCSTPLAWVVRDLGWCSLISKNGKIKYLYTFALQKNGRRCRRIDVRKFNVFLTIEGNDIEFRPRKR